jgi:methyl-accepting chemotaxis protein
VTNVIAYLIQLSNEQKAMFQEVTEQVNKIDDNIQLIVLKLEELTDKIGQG